LIKESLKVQSQSNAGCFRDDIVKYDEVNYLFLYLGSPYVTILFWKSG